MGPSNSNSKDSLKVEVSTLAQTFSATVGKIVGASVGSATGTLGMIPLFEIILLFQTSLIAEFRVSIWKKSLGMTGISVRFIDPILLGEHKLAAL